MSYEVTSYAKSVRHRLLPSKPRNAHSVFSPFATSKSTMASRLFLFLLLLAHAFNEATAFQPQPLLKTKALESQTRPTSNLVLVPPTPRQPTCLSLKINKKDKPEEKKKMEWGLDLFLVYMTPWRNPNSIFVYLLLLLYSLGKYSETHVIGSQ